MHGTPCQLKGFWSINNPTYSLKRLWSLDFFFYLTYAKTCLKTQYCENHCEASPVFFKKYDVNIYETAQVVISKISEHVWHISILVSRSVVRSSVCEGICNNTKLKKGENKHSLQHNIALKNYFFVQVI